MSIADIFREVTTIIVSAWVLVNILGVGITFIGASLGAATYYARPLPCPQGLSEVADLDTKTQHAGIGIYTHHKYQKALHSMVHMGTPLPDVVSQ